MAGKAHLYSISAVSSSVINSRTPLSDTKKKKKLLRSSRRSSYSFSAIVEENTVNFIVQFFQELDTEAVLLTRARRSP